MRFQIDFCCARYVGTLPTQLFPTRMFCFSCTVVIAVKLWHMLLGLLGVFIPFIATLSMSVFPPCVWASSRSLFQCSVTTTFCGRARSPTMVVVIVVYCRYPRKSSCFSLPLLNDALPNAQFAMFFRHLRTPGRGMLCPCLLYTVSLAIVTPVWSFPYYVPICPAWTRSRIVRAPSVIVA